MVAASTTQHRIHVFTVRRVLRAGTTQGKKPGDFAAFSGIEDGDGEEAKRSFHMEGFVFTWGLNGDISGGT